MPAIVEPLPPTGSDVVFGMPPPDPVVVIFDASAMVAVMPPSVRRDPPPVDVDPIVFVDVDIDVAATPIAVTPAPD
jgi:hypothetical protein